MKKIIIGSLAFAGMLAIGASSSSAQDRVTILVGYGAGGTYGPSSQFRGVTRKADQKFQARIGHNGENLFLGSFSSEREAARAYDERAWALKGTEAVLNFSAKARGEVPGAKSESKVSSKPSAKSESKQIDENEVATPIASIAAEDSVAWR